MIEPTPPPRWMRGPRLLAMVLVGVALLAALAYAGYIASIWYMFEAGAGGD